MTTSPNILEDMHIQSKDLYKTVANALQFITIQHINLILDSFEAQN